MVQTTGKREPRAVPNVSIRLFFFYSSFSTRKNYLFILFGHFHFVDDTSYYPFIPLGHLLMLRHIIHLFRSVICWCYVTLSIHSVRAFMPMSHFPFIPCAHALFWQSEICFGIQLYIFTVNTLLCVATAIKLRPRLTPLSYARDRNNIVRANIAYVDYVT